MLWHAGIGPFLHKQSSLARATTCLAIPSSVASTDWAQAANARRNNMDKLGYD